MTGYPAEAVKEVRIEDADKVMLLYKQTGDTTLRNQLVMHYIRYVSTAIFSMKSILLSSVPYEDFFNQGVLALIGCIERYDPDKGASFETYSYSGIRGSILKYLRKQNWLPNRLWTLRKEIAQAKKALEQQHMRQPTEEELAAHLGMSAKKLSQCLAEIAVVETISFEELISNAQGTLPSSLFDDGGDIGSDMLERELQTALAAAIDKLPPKEKQVIALYYYENLNLREIGEVLDLSLQRISQYKTRALSILHSELEHFGSYIL